MADPTPLRPATLEVADGYVVWDPDEKVVHATEEGAFVWDNRADAWRRCRKGTNDRPRRVQVIFGD